MTTSPSSITSRSEDKKGWEFADFAECLSWHDKNSTFPGYCNSTWDGFLCWPLTAPGSLAQQLCPENVKGILRGRYAERKCSEDGFWMAEDGEEAMDPSWTNFTGCFTADVAKVLDDFYGTNSSSDKLYTIVHYTRIFEMVGYSISFVSIVASLCILSAFRRLKTKEKAIHKQLYLAMLIQVVVRLILYTDQFVSRKDQTTGSEGTSQEETRGIDNTPYLCESFYVLLEYARTAMFFWFFIEGLHLHSVLTMDSFGDGAESTRSIYFIIGWGVPVIMTTAWAITTGMNSNSHCWFGYSHTLYYWIVEGPRLALIAINLLFLLNILRVLLTKLRNNSSSETMKLRKAVRAAIVLQPLLGITNSLQMVATPDSTNIVYFATWSVVTTFLVSFQGFFASLFYCFLNGEVRSVLAKYFGDLRTQRDIHKSVLYKRRQSVQSTNSKTHLTTKQHDNRSRNNSSLTPLPKILPNHTEVIEFNGHENGRNDFEMAEMVTMLQTKTNSHQDAIETIVSVNH